MKPNKLTTLSYVFIFLSVSAFLWLAFSFHAKSKYEKARDNLYQELGPKFMGKQMDEVMQNRLANIEETWTCRGNEINGPHSEALCLAGMTPSVNGILELFNYRMPPYSWTNAKQNTKSLEIATVQAIIIPSSMDRIVHISKDNNLALIRINENCVYIFREKKEGLSEGLWVWEKGKKEGE